MRCFRKEWDVIQELKKIKENYEQMLIIYENMLERKSNPYNASGELILLIHLY